MAPTVHLIAAGVRCALGLSAEGVAAAVRAGISRFADDAHLVDSVGEGIRCVRMPGLDNAASVATRMSWLAEGALNEAITKVTTGVAMPPTIPVWIAVPEDRPGFGSVEMAAFERALTDVRPGATSLTVRLVGRGHAGVGMALRAAMDRIVSGDEELCLVGGVDSYLDPPTMAWLESTGRLAREKRRGGFVPGEAAAFFAIASEAVRRRLNLPSLARIRTVSTATDGRDPSAEVGTLGEGLTAALVDATRDLRLPDEAITDVYGDINGERHRTEDWGFALMRASKGFRDGTAYVTPVGSCGDIGAATVALGCILAAQAWRRRYAIGSRALVWAGSWTGLRAAVVLEQAGG